MGTFTYSPSVYAVDEESTVRPSCPCSTTVRLDASLGARGVRCRFVSTTSVVGCFSYAAGSPTSAGRLDYAVGLGCTLVPSNTVGASVAVGCPFVRARPPYCCAVDVLGVAAAVVGFS